MSQFLCALKGISEAKVEKILEAAEKLQFSSFMTHYFFNIYQELK